MRGEIRALSEALLTASQPSRLGKQTIGSGDRRSREYVPPSPSLSIGRSARSLIDARRHHQLLSQQRMRGRAAEPVLVLRNRQKCARPCAEEKATGKTVPMGRTKYQSYRCPSTRMRAHMRGGPFHSSRRSIYAYICTFVTYLFLPLPLPLPCSCTTASVAQAKTSQQVKYQHEKRKKNKKKQGERRSPLKSTSHPVALNPLSQRRIHYMHAF